MTLGERIHTLRKKQKWSLERFANKLGVHTDTVFKWEHDQHEPNLINLICLADIFKMTLDDLVGRKFK